jgi:hypothetical protein
VPVLVLEEREEIAMLRAEGKGVREIAREIGRSPSTISRELRRNAATRGAKLEYRASVRSSEFMPTPAFVDRCTTSGGPTITTSGEAGGRQPHSAAVQRSRASVRPGWQR